MAKPLKPAEPQQPGRQNPARRRRTRPAVTLANERTFLASIRTALALLAGGVAVEAFMPELFLPELRKTLAVLLLILALFVDGGSYFRYPSVSSIITAARGPASRRGQIL